VPRLHAAVCRSEPEDEPPQTTPASTCGDRVRDGLAILPGRYGRPVCEQRLTVVPFQHLSGEDIAGKHDQPPCEWPRATGAAIDIGEAIDIERA